MTHLDGAVLVEANDGLDDLQETIAEPRVLESEAEPYGLAFGNCLVVSGPYRVQASLCAESPVVHDLAWSPDDAGRHRVAVTHLPGIYPSLLGEAVDDALHGELGLVGPKSSESPTDGVVRPHRDGLHVDGRHAVRA